MHLKAIEVYDGRATTRYQLNEAKRSLRNPPFDPKKVVISPIFRELSDTPEYVLSEE